MKVAYLGPQGTFTEKAAKNYFSVYYNAEFIPIQPIRRVIMAVENSDINFGIVPLENFYNGEVRETIDALLDVKKTKIIGETSIEVVHCLGSLSNNLKDITRILSKDQAIEQCSEFLCEKLPNAYTLAVASTSEAIQIAKTNGDLSIGVIASEAALIKEGFNVLAKDLCVNNKTRFAILSQKSNLKITGDDKTFLAIHPPKDKSGVLYNILKFFAEENINLEDLKSRPDGKGGYYFYIELDGHEKQEKVDLSLRKIKEFLDPNQEYDNAIKIFGSYKNSFWKESKNED